MNNVTIIMPISRAIFLDQIFARLELLACDRSRTNILTIVDGDAQLFTKARNLTEMSKFGERLCVQFKSKHKLRQYDILGRRMRIADIHNFAKQHIQQCEFVLGIEDDTLIPTNTLAKLMKDYMFEPFAGFIQGVEMGRWGIPYIGAWEADDIYDTGKIESLPLGEGLKEIDAGGMYCFMTRMETYVGHEFKPFDNNGLGPDVDFGIQLRRQGMQNFVDWDIKCTHKRKDQDVAFANTEPRPAKFIKKNGRWRHNGKI